MAKTRPCVVVSPEDLNLYLKTVIIVPVTSTLRGYPYRVRCRIGDREGEIATDQVRTVDKSRLKGCLGVLDETEITRLRKVFHEMLCE